MVDGASAILLGLHDMYRQQMIGRWSARLILRQDEVFSQSHFLYQSQYHFPGRRGEHDQQEGEANSHGTRSFRKLPKVQLSHRTALTCLLECLLR